MARVFNLPCSILDRCGYGVYAGRDFARDEIVELAPFFLSVEYHMPFVLHSALLDYVYGYKRWLLDHGSSDDGSSEGRSVNLAAIVWGMTMWYNGTIIIRPNPTWHGKCLAMNLIPVICFVILSMFKRLAFCGSARYTKRRRIIQLVWRRRWRQTMV